MRRFGFRFTLVCLLLTTLFASGCALHADPCAKTYDEKEMGQLATLTRVVLDIVRSDYLDAPMPETLTEQQVIETVRRLNTDFAELRMLDRYDMLIVSDGQQLAAVVWDPLNDRKLIEDLRCTRKLDAAVWRECASGGEFMLGWEGCR